MKQLNTFDNKSVKRIADTVAYVDNITGGLPASQRQFGDNDFKIKLTSETVTPGQWNATEVVFDGSDFVVPPDPELWDTATPIIISGGAGAVDDVLTAESLSNTSGDTVWVAFKTSVEKPLWAKITSGSGKNYLGAIFDDPIETNPALLTGVTIYAHNVDFGSVNVDAILPTQLVGTTYYIYPATFGG